MANLPAKQPDSSELRLIEAVAEHIAAGKRPNEIAMAAHPDDPAARKLLRRKIWNLVRREPLMAAAVAEKAQGEMVLALGPATRALGLRASRGRPDAIKLLYEASGFHNPKVQHQHSGEINIKLDMPRPNFDTDGDIVDADVVD